MPSPPPVPAPGSLGVRALKVLTRLNLEANPRTAIQVGPSRREVLAHTASA